LARTRKGLLPDRPDEVATYTHKAFQRLARIFANLVCGIWLLLVLGITAMDASRPTIGTLVVLILVSAPVAYVIPYGLIRGLGSLVVMWKSRNEKLTRHSPRGRHE
jgi:hypothetical protein